jgi:hypothetical protein
LASCEEKVKPIDVTLLEEYKKMTKEKQVILNSVKEHLIPHIVRKKNSKEMFDVLVALYQSENINQKMLLNNKPGATWMSQIPTPDI